MSDAKHTPGELDVFVGNANGRGLIRIEQSGTGKHIASMPRGEQSEVDATRMVACWNAMVDVPDPAAFVSMARTMERGEWPPTLWNRIEELTRQNAALIAERDRLRAALTEIASAWPNGDLEENYRRQGIARAALAPAKGGAG